MFSEEKFEYLRKFQEEYCGSKCELCHGSGLPCPCRDELHIEWSYVKADIPLEHLVLTLDDIVQPELSSVKAKIKTYIDNLDTNINSGTGLLLCGDCGTGKTSFGCIVLKEAIKAGHSGYFASLEDCVNLVTGGWRDKAMKEEFENRILNSKVLLLDDIGGTEIHTPGNHALITSTFTTLFKERGSNLRPTILTSNLKPDVLRANYGPRLYSVMMQRLDFIEIDAQFDYRQLKSNNAQKYQIIPRRLAK
jgi:DNA replication protein DnaC